MSEEHILVRVYKDVEVKDDDDYIENAIEVATDCLSDFDVEILEEEQDNDWCNTNILYLCNYNMHTGFDSLADYIFIR